jgi:hypothetical protein
MTRVVVAPTALAVGFGDTRSWLEKVRNRRECIGRCA